MAYTSNAVDYSPNNIAIVALSAWFGMEYQLPSFKVVAIDKTALAAFVGTYSSKDIPLKLTVFTENDQLMAQATGQGAFPLEAINTTTFKFDPAGIVIEFDAAAKKLALKQGGMVMNFVQE